MDAYINQDFKAIKTAIEDLLATDEGKKKLAFELASLLNRVSGLEEKVQVVITASESESTKPKPKTTMYPPVKNKLSDRRLVTKQEMDALYVSTAFGKKSTDVVWHQRKGSKVPRFVEFNGQADEQGCESEFFDESYGVFKIPIAGRYQFRIAGNQLVEEAPEINAKTDWYLCWDEGNDVIDDNDNDHDDDDDDTKDDNDEAKQRRPIKFDIDEEYKVYKNETRKLLFSLDGGKRCQRRVVFVGLECFRRTHVWVECVKIRGEFSEIGCGFGGSLVD